MNMMGVSFIQFLNNSLVIIGLVLLVVGISLLSLSKRITMAVRKQDSVDANDKVFTSLRVFGLLLMLAGFICITANTIVYIINR